MKQKRPVRPFLFHLQLRPDGCSLLPVGGQPAPQARICHVYLSEQLNIGFMTGTDNIVGPDGCLHLAYMCFA